MYKRLRITQLIFVILRAFAPSCQKKYFSKLTRVSIVVITLLFSISSQGAIVFGKSHSPYYLNTSLTIADSDTMFILAGTTIIIDSAVDIIVNGTLLIQGTSDDPVNLLPRVDSVGWGRIYLNKAGANCSFNHVKIVDGTVLSNGTNLTYRNVDFINRQNLPQYFNITRAKRGRVDFQNCSIKGIGKGEGFLLSTMTNAIIRNCSFDNIPDAIEFISVNDSKISNNLFVNIPDDAIDLNNCRSILIDSNMIFNAHDRGMEIGSETFGSSLNIIVYRNLVVACKEGITFKEGSTGKVMNNTLYQNETGLVCIEWVDGRGGSKVEIENTIISQSKRNTIETDSQSLLSINYSLSDKLLMEGAHNLYANPRFKDPENRDFSLKETSPCIDKGSPFSTIDGDGTIADIGFGFYNQDSTFAILPQKTDVQFINSSGSVPSVVTIIYHLPALSKVKIELYNLKGKKVKTILSKMQIYGDYRIPFRLAKTEPIENGIYLCAITIGKERKSFKIAKVD